MAEENKTSLHNIKTTDVHVDHFTTLLCSGGKLWLDEGGLCVSHLRMCTGISLPHKYTHLVIHT